jgi:hypothetical protein
MKLAHSLRLRLARHDWLHAAIDLVIVIVGVFLGLQANTWNEDRLRQQQGREYRAMLRQDLDTNLGTLVNRRRYYQWVRAEALAAQAGLARPSSEDGEQFLIDSYQASQMLPWAIKRNTYDQILSTGALDELGSPLLRDEISNYYVTADVSGANIVFLPPYREILRRVMPYEVQQRVRSRCPEVVGQDSAGSSQVTPAGACTLGLDQEAVRKAVTQVHDWPQLSLDLNRLIVDLDQKLLSVNLIAARAIETRNDLEKADGVGG